MLNLAQSFGSEITAWLKPTLLGQTDSGAALLPYWLGAWAIQLAPKGLPIDTAAQLPFIALLGPHTGSHLVCGLRTCANTGGTTCDLCIWRRSQTCRLCAGYCRWRFACLACLLGLGQTVSRSHPRTRTTFFFCTSLFCVGQLGSQKNDIAVLLGPRHYWLGTFWRTCFGDAFGGRRRHCHRFGYWPATLSASSKSRCCLGLDLLFCYCRHRQWLGLVAMARCVFSFV